VSGLLNWLADHWDQPEAGIWETRGGAKDFTYGRVMSWSPSTVPSGSRPPTGARRRWSAGPGNVITHLALIDSAITLNAQLDQRSGPAAS
jgi:hypothetical protein